MNATSTLQPSIALKTMRSAIQTLDVWVSARLGAQEDRYFLTSDLMASRRCHQAGQLKARDKAFEEHHSVSAFPAVWIPKFGISYRDALKFAHQYSEIIIIIKSTLCATRQRLVATDDAHKAPLMFN